MSDYPGAIDTFRTIENIPGQTYDPAKQTTVYVEDLEQRSSAILAVENLLGVNMLKVYPIGFVIEFGDSTATPESRDMPGTWVRHCEGKAHYSEDSSDTDFDVVGETGGASTHTLTIAELPVHSHVGGAKSLKKNAQGSSGDEYYGGASGGTAGTGNEATSQSTGDGAAHNNLPPYHVTVCWERTA